MGDPRPFHDEEYARSCWRRSTDFVAAFSSTRNTGDYTTKPSDTGDIDSLIRSLSRLVGYEVNGAEDMEHFHFVLKCVKYPFWLNNLTLGHKSGQERQLVANFSWLVMLLRYERACDVNTSSQGVGVPELYGQLKTIYKVFLEDGQAGGITKPERPHESNELPELLDDIIVTNTRLRSVSNDMLSKIFRARTSVAAKRRLISKLEDARQSFILMSENVREAKSTILQWKSRNVSLQDQSNGPSKEVLTPMKHVHQNSKVMRHSEELSNFRSVVFTHNSAMTELSNSVKLMLNQFTTLAASTRLSQAYAQVFHSRLSLEPHVLVDGELTRLMHELKMSMNDEISRTSFEHGCEVKKVISAENVLHQTICDGENRSRRLTTLEQLVRKLEVQYQNERQSQDNAVMVATQNLRKTEQLCKAFRQTSILTDSLYLERLRNSNAEKARTLLHDKSTIQGHLWLALDRLMLHKQKNHEVFDNWNTDVQSLC